MTPSRWMVKADIHLRLLLSSIYDICNLFVHAGTLSIGIRGHPLTWFGHSRSLIESKWCHHTMVEADIHLWLHDTLIFDSYKRVWANWYAGNAHVSILRPLHRPCCTNIWEFWGMYQVKWYHYKMIEVDIQTSECFPAHPYFTHRY